MMVRVEAKGPRESFHSLMRRFKKACENAGLMREIKRKAHYEKPSDKMRRRMRNQVKRINKENRMREGR